MSSQMIPVDPFDYVVFGATGDLTERKLLPALYHRQIAGQFTDPTRIIGASRSELTSEQFREHADKALKEHLKDGEYDKDEVAKFLARIEYVPVDATTNKGWDALKKMLEPGKDRVRAFYMAVAPSIFGPICDGIRDHKLITKQTRIVVEKPLGRDLASALELNNMIAKTFHEEQVFRIDHYLGKETVQNLMALRFANMLYAPLWNANHIDHIQITVAEDLGLEGRADYYDRSGALRDMVQNHMLQLLCLTAMEPPNQLDDDDVRTEKIKVLNALMPIHGEAAKKQTVRGQYKAGMKGAEVVKGYAEELSGVDESDTETFVAIKAGIDNWRWAGVPFYLRTGKRMSHRHSDIVIQFKKTPHSLFGEGNDMANRLVIRLQPDEGVRLFVQIKEPGPGGMRLIDVPLDMTFADALGPEEADFPDAYERLIMDVIRGNQTLFMRGDEVEAAWAWTDPVIAEWTDKADAPLPYASGSSGPDDALMLMHRDGRRWREIRP